jgi:hypothetical protein
MLLGVHAVVRLREEHRMRPVGHFIGDFLAAVGGQAVHDDGVRIGFSHQPGVDLVGREDRSRFFVSASWPMLVQVSV